MVVMVFVLKSGGPPIDEVIVAALAGFVLGTCQSLVLSPQSRRAVWIIGTAIGWSAAVAVAASFFAERGLVSPVNGVIGSIFSFVVSWAILALIMLFGLIVFFPKAQEKDLDRCDRWWP